jgi:methionyl aminopeptidase
MENEAMEKYLLAGRIAAGVREQSRSIVRIGKSYSDIVNEIEALIRKEGGDPAFPVNISVNDVAAHFTPTIGSTDVIGEKDLVKMDIGVHVDGYVADTAVTVNFNPQYDDMVKAAEAALAAAVRIVTPGVLISDISTAIEETINEAGYKPVSNLTGHGINRWDLHSEPTIPNVSFDGDMRLEEGQIIAIEPFVTDGGGMVKDSEQVFIYTLLGEKPVRNNEARKIISYAAERNGLPFAERWLPIDSLFKIRLALRELRERGILHDYNVLKEIRGGVVAQAEHTIIVEDHPIITTK